MSVFLAQCDRTPEGWVSASSSAPLANRASSTGNEGESDELIHHDKLSGKRRGSVRPSNRRGSLFRRLVLGILCLGAIFTARATEWTFAPGAGISGTITDGQRTLEVTKFDRASGSLEFSSWKSPIKA